MVTVRDTQMQQTETSGGVNGGGELRANHALDCACILPLGNTETVP